MSKRLLELDSLRGIAALLVLMSHYTWAYDYHFGTLKDHSFNFSHGEFGVEVFFIISGFVIFMSLQNISSIKHFVIARFSRLYPTYWLCMLITLLIITLFPVPTLGDFSLKEILANLTMIQAYLKVRHIDQVYWSLGVELVFYFLVGLIFYLNKLKNIHYVSILWLLACFISFNYNYHFENYIKIIFILPFAPLFISGIMFYKIKNKESSYLTHIIIILSLIIYLLNIKSKLVVNNQFEITGTRFLLIISAYVVFYLFSYFELSILKNRIFVFFGKISYPLYLLHNVIGYVIIYRIKQVWDNEFVYVLIPFLITTGLAYLVSEKFEIKSSKWTKSKLTKYLIK